MPVCLSASGDLDFHVPKSLHCRPDRSLMCHALSHCRPLLHAALAALVVAALSRCSWEESRELAQLMRTVELLRLGNTAPVQAPLHDCDRESGCICRGATQAHAIDATHCNPVFSD